ncbi:Mating-type switching protein-like protein [Hapsidospora chrysogenum ATCC 11550]|uniref:Mating-type switching protein-like protein n=1 Tax=Hapsidospora chrysogenum (strain ATCC 11550 / CBS 779.69 / DSM 880 / IAM 14645 / JCM 23072 / IMI 49137) TaxID=857340 RepID=A0A086STJ7_HAPC1|nr:Mating-type switching protein-like protein [Hapsidospora chrysogenum ATCC 11550]
MDDDYGADDALLEALAAADTSQPARKPTTTTVASQPKPHKIQQPTPQRLDKAPPSTTGSSGSKIEQPKPQALPQRPAGSTILVSPRQRGNPVLTSIKSIPWEYSDIPADYAMGGSTCALFLSLKYHRLHPEYIYTRIRNLQGRYTVRILLTMVDISNHEDPLRELSKTSLVNNVTLMLCWSAAEAARYLELYKSYENAGFAAIKGQQGSSYADKLVDFVTVPRGLNKSDAVSLVANFGSLRNAVNADAEHLGMISGWGGTKVKRWSAALDEPFRVKKTGRRKLEKSSAPGAGDGAALLDRAIPIARASQPPSMGTARGSQAAGTSGGTASQKAPAATSQYQLMGDIDDEDEEAMLAAAIEESKRTAQPGSSRKQQQEEQQHAESSQRRGEEGDGLSGGIAAALAKLRENAG